MDFTYFDNYQVQQYEFNYKLRKLLAIAGVRKAILRKELPSMFLVYKHLLLLAAIRDTAVGWMGICLVHLPSTAVRTRLLFYSKHTINSVPSFCD